MQKIKECKDKLEAVGVFIEEEEVLHIVLDGLSDELYPFCTALRTQNEPVSLEELHVLITTEERSLKLKFESSNNLVRLAMIGTGPKPNPGNNSPIPPFNAQLNAQSHRGRGGRYNNFRGRGGRNNFHRGGSQFNFYPSQQSNNAAPNYFFQRPMCQICYKMGRTALDCYHRMDFAFQGKHPPTKLAAMAFSSNASSSNCWVFDTAAIDHFTPELANIQQPQAYPGNDSATVGNGETLPITHIGNAQLHASKHILHLRHTLRVPNMKSNLLSVFKCYKDNHCRFIFDASAVTIQDIPSGKVLYIGRNEAGLYPIYGAPFSRSEEHTSELQSP